MTSQGRPLSEGDEIWDKITAVIKVSNSCKETVASDDQIKIQERILKIPTICIDQEVQGVVVGISILVLRIDD